MEVVPVDVVDDLTKKIAHGPDASMMRVGHATPPQATVEKDLRKLSTESLAVKAA